MQLAENLRVLRTKSGRTLEEVAVILDVSRQSVAKLETGDSYPDIDKCARLAKLYNVSLDALVNKSIDELLKEPTKDDRYIFGVTKVREDGTIMLPKNAIDVLKLKTDDALMVFGDKKQGLAIIKCGELKDFISGIESKKVI